MAAVASRYEAVRRQVADAADAVGRDPRDVLIVAVTKTVGIDDIRHALIGLAFEMQEQVRMQTPRLLAAADQIISDVTRPAQGILNHIPIVGSLSRSLGLQYDAMQKRGEDRLQRWIAIGQREEARSRVLADQTFTRIVDDVINYLADKPEVQDLIAGQTTGLAGEVLNEVRERTVSGDSFLEGIVRAVLLILLVVLGVYSIDLAVDHFFVGVISDRRRMKTLRVVARFVVQAAGVLLILFVVLGIPNQMPTILGLAGAGLTVALKDFIVAFFGWFALMGRNGIRVGDWVEIQGVVGEVAEIGLLRTVLLETGNWNDAGHPTGRKVAFVNSFAIEEHYFNFSTSGQWLWDELQILVPSSQNPYPILDALQKLVTASTESNARMAEEEWQRATQRDRTQNPDRKARFAFVMPALSAFVGGDVTAGGENGSIALPGASSPAAIVAGWSAHPAHRELLFNPQVRYAGAGVYNFKPGEYEYYVLLLVDGLRMKEYHPGGLLLRHMPEQVHVRKSR